MICDICGDPLADSFTTYQAVSPDGGTMMLCETCRRHRPRSSNVVIFPYMNQLPSSKGGVQDDEPFAA